MIATRQPSDSGHVGAKRYVISSTARPHSTTAPDTAPGRCQQTHEGYASLATAAAAQRLSTKRSHPSCGRLASPPRFVLRATGDGAAEAFSTPLMTSPPLTRLSVHRRLCRHAAWTAWATLRAAPLLQRHPRSEFSRCCSSRSSSSFSTFSVAASATLPHRVRPFSTSSRAEKKATYQRRGYQDRVRVQVTGGRGGAGCSSFARTFKGIGAPNGGSGGRGGDVYVQCSEDSSTGYSFSSFHFKGQQGQPGQSDNKGGKRGDDVVITVPRGTVVSRITGRDPDTLELGTEVIADLDEAGQRVLVAKGGDGGWGNRAFVTGYRSNNRFSSTGSEGESAWLLLELRLIADVGLVGFPNAGKSSLLDRVSNAQPKIASYPFTTLQPQVGVVEVAGRHQRGEEEEGGDMGMEADASTAMDSFSMADLPGLIDDAHLDVGLGHSFLQHLKRCPLLLYVIDASGAPAQPPASARDPCEDFISLRRELRLYDEALLQKPWLVFANQMDRRKREARKHLKRLAEVVQAEVELEGGSHFDGRSRVLSGSCVTGEGVDALVARLWEAKRRVDEVKAREKEEAERRLVEQRAEAEIQRQRQTEDRQLRYEQFQQRRARRKALAASHPVT